MKRTLQVVLFVIVAFSFVLAACGGGKAAEPSKFAAAGWKEVLEFNDLYTQTYNAETSASAAFKDWWAYVDNGFKEIKDLKFLSDNCYSNADKILKDGTIGMYDTSRAADGAPNGVLDTTKLVSALVVNDLYPAHASECASKLDFVMTKVVEVRTKGYEKQSLFIDRMRALDNLYNDTLPKAVGKRLLDNYGVEFIAYANGMLKDHGIAEFPADFIGFPTTGLNVNTKDREWYQHYADIMDGIKPVTDRRFSKEMYYVIWSGPENKGEATLFRQAAYEFMNRSFLSADTQNSISCGDSGPSLSETTNPDCTTTENNPAAPTNEPTAAPAPAAKP